MLAHFKNEKKSLSVTCEYCSPLGKIAVQGTFRFLELDQSLVCKDQNVRNMFRCPVPVDAQPAAAGFDEVENEHYVEYALGPWVVSVAIDNLQDFLIVVQKKATVCARVGRK